MRMQKKWLAAAVLASVVSMPSWAKYEDVQMMHEQEAKWHQRYDNAEYDSRDPFENLNRAMFRFNRNILDRHIYRPVAVWYADSVPEGARESIENAMLNLDEPSSVVNNILQGNPGDAANAAGRFVVNSTIGLLGLFDVADHMGMHRKQDEFGEVLATWGVGNGPYLMLPAIGPTTVRQGTGDYVDNSYWPLGELNFYASATRFVLKGLYTRVQLLDQERLLEQSLDPYTFVKEAYFQRVAFAVYDGNPPEQQQQQEQPDLDSYMDEIDGAN